MTHSLTIELPEAVYQSLSEEAEQKGKKAEDVVVEMVELLMTDRKLGDDEFERLADELADYVEKNLPPDAKPLSDYAMSREGIYEDHL
jgi:antitoxin ParD1/3/4